MMVYCIAILWVLMATINVVMIRLVDASLTKKDWIMIIAISAIWGPFALGVFGTVGVLGWILPNRWDVPKEKREGKEGRS